MGQSLSWKQLCYRYTTPLYLSLIPTVEAVGVEPT